MRATTVAGSGSAAARTSTAVVDPPYPRGLISPSRRGRSERKIGDVIVDLGFATPKTVKAAIAAAHDQGATTGQVLVEAGALQPEQLARALAERFGLHYIDLSVFELDIDAVGLVSAQVARRYRALPVGFMADGFLLLAMAEPADVVALDEMAMITGMAIRPAAASPDDLAALISRLGNLAEVVTEAEEQQPEPAQLVLAEDRAVDAPIVKLVRSIIADAVTQGASDIHCKPERGEMRVLFRVDGVLTPAATVAGHMAPGLISRIKVMASLDIAERRAPQDGRLVLMLEGRRIDVRVVTLPLVTGEGVVMRVLDSGAVARDLHSLGMDVHSRERLEKALAKPLWRGSGHRTHRIGQDDDRL